MLVVAVYWSGMMRTATPVTSVAATVSETTNVQCLRRRPKNSNRVICVRFPHVRLVSVGHGMACHRP